MMSRAMFTGSFKKTVYILAPLILYFVTIRIFIYGLQILYTLGVHTGAAHGLFTGHAAFFKNAVSITSYALMIMLLILVYGKTDDLKAAFKKTEVKDIPRMMIVFATGGVFSVGLNLLAAFILEHVKLGGDMEVPSSFDPSETSFAAGLILYCLLAPVLEELVFRWLEYGRIKRCFSGRIAVIVSSLFFAVLHFNPVQMVYAFIMGCIMAFIMERYDDLKLSMLFHIAANCLIFIPAYF